MQKSEGQCGGVEVWRDGDWRAETDKTDMTVLR